MSLLSALYLKYTERDSHQVVLAAFGRSITVGFKRGNCKSESLKGWF